MAPATFRCPTTGLDVQWAAEEVPPEKGSAAFKGIACTACTRLLFLRCASSAKQDHSQSTFLEPIAAWRVLD